MQKDVHFEAPQEVLPHPMQAADGVLAACGPASESLTVEKFMRAKRQLNAPGKGYRHPKIKRNIDRRILKAFRS